MLRELTAALQKKALRLLYFSTVSGTPVGHPP